MIKIGMTTSGVNEMIQVLGHFPELAEKHYRPAVKRSIEGLRALITGNIPRGATGRAASTFGAKVTGKGFRIKGQVGWYDKSDPYYPNVLEYGARPHTLNKGSKSRTRREFAAFKAYANNPVTKSMGSSGGVPVLVKGSWKTIHIHPGMQAMGFMASGYSTYQPIVENDLFMANERILGEFAAMGSK